MRAWDWKVGLKRSYEYNQSEKRDSKAVQEIRNLKSLFLVCSQYSKSSYMLTSELMTGNNQLSL
jgi:hypothetical protein